MIDSLVLPNFVIFPEVFRADIMTSSIYTAKFLIQKPEFYQNKHVIDMGCGSGILGIVMAKRGAESVLLADISYHAIANAWENITQYGMVMRLACGYPYHSDLFSAIRAKYDLIVFNHPFFSDEIGFPDQPISGSMVAPSILIHRFLEEAKGHLTKEGKIIMPFLEIAGETNDPKIQAPKHGYTVQQVYSTNVESGVQTGLFYVYVLNLR